MVEITKPFQTTIYIIINCFLNGGNDHKKKKNYEKAFVQGEWLTFHLSALARDPRDIRPVLAVFARVTNLMAYSYFLITQLIPRCAAMYSSCTLKSLIIGLSFFLFFRDGSLVLSGAPETNTLTAR